MTARSQPINGHTPTPWAAQEFDLEEMGVAIIGLRAECPDGPTNGIVAYAALFPTEQDDAESGVTPVRAIANAALIVEAVNSYAALKARIAELEAALQKAASYMPGRLEGCGCSSCRAGEAIESVLQLKAGS